jgi:hypothetical protein
MSIKNYEFLIIKMHFQQCQHISVQKKDLKL